MDHVLWHNTNVDFLRYGDDGGMVMMVAWRRKYLFWGGE